jgi:hypothetical protein
VLVGKELCSGVNGRTSVHCTRVIELKFIKVVSYIVRAGERNYGC